MWREILSKNNFLMKDVGLNDYAVLKSFGKIPTLTLGQERSLFALYALNGSKKIEKRIFDSNLKFLNRDNRLVKFAKAKKRPIRELFSAACVGLMEAIHRYDYKRGFKFYTYADYWIMHEIQMFCYNDTGVIGTRQYLEARKYVEKIEEIENNFTSEEKENKIKDLYKHTVYDMVEIELVNSVVKIDKSNIETYEQFVDTSNNIENVIENEYKEILYNLIHKESKYCDFDDLYLNWEISNGLRRNNNRDTRKNSKNDFLTDREKKLLRLRFYEGYTLEECSAKMGFTRQGIEQMEKLVLKRIKNKLTKIGGV